MAKKKAKTERVIKFSQNEFVQAVVDCVRLKKEAAEYSGRHGARVALFTEKTGFSRQAFKFLVGLKKLDDDLKAQSIMDEIVMGFELLGFNDQGRLFDRVEQRKADKISPDKDESDGANVVAFQKNAMPLGEVAKTLTQNNVKAAAKRERRAAAAEAAAPKKRGRPAKEAAPVPEGSFTMEAPSWQREDRMPGPGAEDDEAWEKQ